MTNVSDNSQKSPFIYSSLFWHPHYEVWKPVVGYEGEYEVSNYGRVKSLSRYALLKNSNGKLPVKEKILKLNRTKFGYEIVGLRKNKRPKYFSVHRLVAQLFVSNPHNKPYVNHMDMVRNNNTALNLEWCTHSENIKHGYATNKNRRKPTYITGVSHTCKKVINTETGYIYPSCKDAAKLTGYNKATLCQWLNGRYENKSTLKYL